MSEVYDQSHFHLVHANFRSGAFGRVTINRRRSDNAEVAIKWPDDPSDIQKEILYHEFVSQCSLIVTLHGIVKNAANNSIGIVLEACYLETLQETIFDVEVQLLYNISHIVVWMEQLASAITFMKNKGIVHRDIKPDNILMRNNFREIRLCDFGIAAQQESVGSHYGVGPYHAPRRLFNLTHYKDDVYGAAMVFWSLVYRESPFNRMRQTDYRSRIDNGNRPRSTKQIHQNIQAIIESCWAHQLSVRWESEQLLATMTDWKNELFRHQSFSAPALCKKQYTLIRPHGTFECSHHRKDIGFFKLVTLLWKPSFVLVKELGFCLPKSDRVACREQSDETISSSLQVNQSSNGVEKSDEAIFNEMQQIVRVRQQPLATNSSDSCDYFSYFLIVFFFLFCLIAIILFVTDEKSIIRTHRRTRDIQFGWWFFWIVTFIGAFLIIRKTRQYYQLLIKFLAVVLFFGVFLLYIAPENEMFNQKRYRNRLWKWLKEWRRDFGGYFSSFTSPSHNEL